MRLAACAALSLVALLGVGCNGGDGDAVPRWDAPPRPAEDGSVSVAEFADYQDDVDERWERSAELVAAEFLRFDDERREAPTTTITARSEGEGGGPRTVVVTFDLLDDSVRQERWTLELERDGEVYALESAAVAWRCQAGRGHEDFAPEFCV